MNVGIIDQRLYIFIRSNQQTEILYFARQKMKYNFIFDCSWMIDFQRCLSHSILSMKSNCKKIVFEEKKIQISFDLGKYLQKSLRFSGQVPGRTKLQNWKRI